MLRKIPDMIKAVGIGHSHLQAVYRADMRRRESAPPGGGPGISFSFIRLNAKELMPEFEKRGRDLRLNRRLLAALRQELEADGRGSDLFRENGLITRLKRLVTDRLGPQSSRPAAEKIPAAGNAGVFVFLSIGGNMHAIFGLLNHPQPFDFVLKDGPGLPVSPGAEIVAYDLVREVMKRRMGRHLDLLAALGKTINAPMYHLQPPPPIPSEEHIKKYPGVFKEKVAELGVSPPVFRYKLWRIQSSIYEEACAVAGIKVLPVPGEAVDADGFLLQKAWGKDPTHGNEWYGELVLRQLEKTAKTELRLTQD